MVVRGNTNNNSKLNYLINFRNATMLSAFLLLLC